MSENPLILIILVFSIIFITFVVIIKYFLNPLFLLPKFNLIETIKYLERKKYLFIEKRSLTKKEKKQNPFKIRAENILEKIYYSKSCYIVVAFDRETKLYKMFWLQLKKPLGIVGNLKAEFIIEEDMGLNLKLQKQFSKISSLLSDICPACNSKIRTNEQECSECGLIFPDYPDSSDM